MSWLSQCLRLFVFGVLIVACICEETTQDSSASASIRGEAQDFNADVSKILGILINNLYTNRDIFLREVISNGSDALDKIRFLYLTNALSPKNQHGEEPTMDIRIRIDKELRTLTITDGGVGMNKDELSANLGMLGASGTKAFLEKINESKDANLIGQFGVGFYSVFLVADTVRVSSKTDSCDVQWTWESSGDGKFYLYEDPRGNSLGRGTELTLQLKQDADEFLSVAYIKETVRRYSEYIHFPIYIEVTETKRVPKTVTDEPEDSAVVDGHTDTAEDVDGDTTKTTEDAADDADESADTKKAKKAGQKGEELEDVLETRWELINENKPIWTRPTTEVTEEEYNKFFKVMSQEHEDPLYYAHFKAEGDVDFNSILYIPSRAGSDSFSSSAAEKCIRLYVRRVFITDEFKDLLPRYLSFIQGVVDSDDLPLNVSRELLQESRVLKIIKKKLVRKALSMIAEIASQDQKLDEEKKKKEAADTETASGDEETKEQEDDSEKKGSAAAAGSKVLKDMTYDTFWERFGIHIRLGVIEDTTNKARLTKLLRYRSSKHEDKWITLDEYVERMPSTQKNLFYVTGESVSQLKALPVVEDALKRDVEVLYMTEPMDEYVMSHLTEYRNKKFMNLSKEGVKLGTTSAKDKKIETKRKAKYEVLLSWFQKTLGEKVSKVVLTNRQTSEPVIVSSSQYGPTAMMYTILKHQTLNERTHTPTQEVKKILELNYLHPLIDELFKRVQADEEDPGALSAANVLFETASLMGGFEVANVREYAKHVDTMIRSGLEVSSDAALIDEDLSEYEVDDSSSDTDEIEELDEQDFDSDKYTKTEIPLNFKTADGEDIILDDTTDRKGSSKATKAAMDDVTEDEVHEDL